MPACSVPGALRLQTIFPLVPMTHKPGTCLFNAELSQRFDGPVTVDPGYSRGFQKCLDARHHLFSFVGESDEEHPLIVKPLVRLDDFGSFVHADAAPGCPCIDDVDSSFKHLGRRWFTVKPTFRLNLRSRLSGFEVGTADQRAGTNRPRQQHRRKQPGSDNQS